VTKGRAHTVSRGQRSQSISNENVIKSVAAYQPQDFRLLQKTSYLKQVIRVQPKNPMNRMRFFVLLGMSGLLAVLLLTQILVNRQINFEQNRLGQAQQILNQGQTSQADLKALAVRVYQDAQKTNDPGLKDILSRNQISFQAAPQSDRSGPPPSTSPARTPAPAPVSAN
jgi:hypothetical protein